MASPRIDIEEPLGASALAATASAAATALSGIARRSTSPGVAAQADALRTRAIDAAARNADAYGQALVARDAASELPPDQRDWEIGRAFAEAAGGPLELAHVAADLADLAAEIALHAEAEVKADAVVAAALAAGVARGAVALVAVNLTTVPNDLRVAEAEELAEAAARATARAAAAGA